MIRADRYRSHTSLSSHPFSEAAFHLDSTTIFGFRCAMAIELASRVHGGGLLECFLSWGVVRAVVSVALFPPSSKGVLRKLEDALCILRLYLNAGFIPLNGKSRSWFARQVWVFECVCVCVCVLDHSLGIRSLNSIPMGWLG